MTSMPQSLCAQSLQREGPILRAGSSEKATSIDRPAKGGDSRHRPGISTGQSPGLLTTVRIIVADSSNSQTYSSLTRFSGRIRAK